MDADGNDNTPEWGYCTHPDGCHEDALPLWLAGDFPDEPDLFLCPMHIGLHIAGLREVCKEVLAIAEARRAGTWDDVMRLMRGALK